MQGVRSLILCLLALISCGKDKPVDPDNAVLGGPPEESLIWQFRTDTPGERVITSPTVADGVVYVGSNDSYVYALGAENGDLLWSFETTSDLKSPPMVADGVVHVRDPGNHYALNASTGELLWKDDSGFASGDSLVSDGIVYIATLSEGFIVKAVDAVSGEQMWVNEMFRSALSGIPFPLLLPLTAGGSNLYVSDDQQVHALDRTTGELMWSFRAEGTVQTPLTVAGGKVCIMVDTAHALDEATGEPLWSYDVTGPTGNSPPVVVDGVWYLSADELHALDAETGQRLWFSDVNNPSGPVVADGMVFVTNSSGALYALDAATGAKVWSLEAERYRYQRAELLVDGILYTHSSEAV